jgi:hypothetical protein
VEPFTCIPANLVVLAIEEMLDRPVELAESKIEDCFVLSQYPRNRRLTIKSPIIGIEDAEEGSEGKAR